MTGINQQRRQLLKLLGTGAAALAFSKSSARPNADPIPRIGLQLYSIRNSIETDFDGAMRKAADIGLAGIETYTLPPNVTLLHASGTFKELGLKVLGMHTALPVGTHRDAVLRMADAYDCDSVIYPGGPDAEKCRTLDGMQRMVEVYNETAGFLEGRGLHFGLHNHAWEFELNDGYYPFYYLLNHLDKNVFFEIDTYWAKTGGKDPAVVVADFGKRAPLLHIKDGPAVKGDAANKQVPAGEGAMDFPAIARAGRETTRWMIIEFDQYDKDIFEGIRKSYTFLTKNGLAGGREQ